MGQLLGLPSCTAADKSFVDCLPTIFSECLVKAKVSGQRFLQFKKRSYDESLERFFEILFNKSLFEEETLESPPLMPATKKRRKEKQVVRYTDCLTGERHRLYPKMSLW